MSDDIVDKLTIIVGFTFGMVILTTLVGAALGAMEYWTPSRSMVVSGALTGGVIGGVTGLLNGFVLAAVTARFYHPLQNRKGYRVRMTLLALAFTAIGVLFLLVMIPYRSIARC